MFPYLRIRIWLLQNRPKCRISPLGTCRTLGIPIHASVRARISLPLPGIQRTAKNQAPTRDTLVLARHLGWKTATWSDPGLFQNFRQVFPFVSISLKDKGQTGKILTVGRDNWERKGHLGKRSDAAPWMAESFPSIKRGQKGNRWTFGATNRKSADSSGHKSETFWHLGMNVWKTHYPILRYSECPKVINTFILGHSEYILMGWSVFPNVKSKYIHFTELKWTPNKDFWWIYCYEK